MIKIPFPFVPFYFIFLCQISCLIVRNTSEAFYKCILSGRTATGRCRRALGLNSSSFLEDQTWCGEHKFANLPRSHVRGKRYTQEPFTLIMNQFHPRLAVNPPRACHRMKRKTAVWWQGTPLTSRRNCREEDTGRKKENYQGRSGSGGKD